MAVSWETYLSAPRQGIACRDCRLAYTPRLAPLSAAIRRLIERLEPASIACLGAGMLNDIPYDALIGSGAEIHLVDWLPQLVESGVARSIIACDPNGTPRCLYCYDGDGAGGADPRVFCRNFVAEGRAETEQVCDNFEAAPGDPATCRAFVRGDCPRVHGADVTGGYASEFGRAIGAAVGQAKSWRHAFKQAGAVSDRARRHRSSLAIPDGGMALVTSSMVISQFEHEPYDYFSKVATERLGLPTPQEERRLAPNVEILRDRLVAVQIDRHLAEIARIMAPDGRCFLAFETMHRARDDREWFVVPQMHDALTAIARQFDFDFEALPAAESTMELDMVTGRSIVQAYALRKRAG